MRRHKVGGDGGPRSGVVEGILVQSLATLVVRVVRTSPHVHPSLWMDWLEENLEQAFEQCSRPRCTGVAIPVPSRYGQTRQVCTKC